MRKIIFLFMLLGSMAVAQNKPPSAGALYNTPFTVGDVPVLSTFSQGVPVFRAQHYTSGGVNPGTTGQITYYAADGSTVSGAAAGLTDGTHWAFGPQGQLNSYGPTTVDIEEITTNTVQVWGTTIGFGWNPTGDISDTSAGIGAQIDYTQNLDAVTNGNVDFFPTTSGLVVNASDTSAVVAFNQLTAITATTTITQNPGFGIALGIQGTVAITGGTGESAGVAGLYGEADLNAAGQVLDRDLVGTVGVVFMSAGQTNFAANLEAEQSVISGSSAVTTLAAVNIMGNEIDSPAEVTNNVGIHIAAIGGGGTNNYPIWSEDTQTSLFMGPLQAAGFTAADGTPGMSGSCSLSTVVTVMQGLVTGCS